MSSARLPRVDAVVAVYPAAVATLGGGVLALAVRRAPKRKRRTRPSRMQLMTTLISTPRISPRYSALTLRLSGITGYG